MSLNLRANNCLVSMGLAPSILETRKLPLFMDAKQLVIADVSRSGREHLLVAEAAAAWSDLKSAAHVDGVELLIISAFRSFKRQAELLRGMLEQGHDAETIFLSMAPPGFSEHHTGRAVDIGTPGCEPLSKEFAATPAFDWLQFKADRFGFLLSYPEGNALGFCYEPWHWCYTVSAA